MTVTISSVRAIRDEAGPQARCYSFDNLLEIIMRKAADSRCRNHWANNTISYNCVVENWQGISKSEPNGE